MKPTTSPAGEVQEARPDRASLVPVLGAITVVWAFTSLSLVLYTGDAPVEIHHYGDFRGGILGRYWDIDASGHFFNTLKRYELGKVSEHWFAVTCPSMDPVSPCITSKDPKPSDAIVNSSKVRGGAVYTSFPPGAMIIVYCIMSFISMVLGDGFSIYMLWGTNLLLMLLTLLIFALVLDRLLPAQTARRGQVLFICLLPLILATEPLHSHHVSMWSQQVCQPIIAGCLLMLTMPASRRQAVLLGALCALGCWVEWTAYLLCGAALVGLWVQSTGLRRRDRISILFLFSGTAVLGGASLLVYYHMLFGSLGPYFAALRVRMRARAMVDYYDWGDWVQSLNQSYAPWILVIMVFSVIALVKARSRNSGAAPALTLSRNTSVVLGTSAFILSENAVMFEHSIVYTFDRLKWGFFLSLLLALVIPGIYTSTVGRVAVTCLTLLAVGLSVLVFAMIYRPYWRGPI